MFIKAPATTETLHSKVKKRFREVGPAWQRRVIQTVHLLPGGVCFDFQWKAGNLPSMIAAPRNARCCTVSGAQGNYSRTVLLLAAVASQAHASQTSKMLPD